MATLLYQLTTLTVELRSTKLTIRNKAAERLDQLLSNSKNDIIALFQQRNGDISFAELFNSAIESAMNHAAKLDEGKDAKNIQTMVNKNYIFTGIVNKLIEYNLENENNFLTKSIIITAFIDGISNRSSIKYFSALFLNLLERGIYKSPCYVRELKVNEYSRILSHLFEANAGNNQFLRFALLHALIKTIELAVERVQIGADIVEYLPEVRAFALNANDDRRKAEVIKLFHLYVTHVSVDYHIAVCSELQDVLPLISDFHNVLMSLDTKATLFRSVYLALCAIYPHAHQGDLSTLGITLKNNWPKTLLRINTLVSLEVKEHQTILYGRTARNMAVDDKGLEIFVRLAAFVTYLKYWPVVPSASLDNEEDASESRCKIPKHSDPLEQVLSLLQLKGTSFNGIWFAIITELISSHPTVINMSNYKQVLESVYGVLERFKSASNLRNIRKCLTTLLTCEQQFLASKSIPAGHCQALWAKVVEFLLAETAIDGEIIAEKYQLLQALIVSDKVTPAQSAVLLQTIMSNATLRRTECVRTIRLMLMYAERCGLDKTQAIMERLITWLNEQSNRFDAKTVLLHLAPIDAALIADTSAIAIINFLNNSDATIETVMAPKKHLSAENRQLLLYKHNRLYVCLEEHGRTVLALTSPETIQSSSSVATPGGDTQQRNCLFQNNYELLMRLLNYETPKETTSAELYSNLEPLYKMVCLMRALLRYEVFDATNYSLCPLIKRIGFFLSHLEFQLKNNNPRNFDRNSIYEILQRLDTIFSIFTTDPVLLGYLEKQPLEELIGFVDAALKFSAAQQLSSDFDDWKSVTLVCLRLLATLCASSTHGSDAFEHISRYKFNITNDLDVLLSLIELFCLHQHRDDMIADWFIDHLKTIFRLFYTHIEIIARIVKMLPLIFSYVQQYENLQQNMLIALISLLKVAYKKSYPEHLTAALIDSMRLITRYCDGIYGLENFTNICLSVAKFLPFPALRIQYATINTLAALFDAVWLKGAKPNTAEHFDFCQQLLNHIDLNNLASATDDLKQNSTSVTVQMLVALFVFSAYYQEFALERLSNVCAKRKLGSTELSFHQIAAFKKCPLTVLTQPHVAHMIHNWTQRSYPIARFPFFLCCEHKDEFFVKNLPTIATCVLLYRNADDFKQLQKYAGSLKALITLTQPAVHALVLPDSAQCPEAKNDLFLQHQQKLVQNLEALNILIPNGAADWKTIYNCVQNLDDATEFRQLFQRTLYGSTPHWYNISFASLKRCLTCLCSLIGDDQTEDLAFAELLGEEPLHLVHTLNALKDDSFTCRSLIDRMRHFHRYCALAELLLDTLLTPPSKAATKKNTRAALNSAKYFARDIIYFVLYYIQNAHSAELQQLPLIFLRHVLAKPIFAQDNCCEVIRSHLNDIVKTLVAVVESTNDESVAQLSLSIIDDLVVQREGDFSEAIALLDDFPTDAKFAELCELQTSLQLSGSGEKDLPSVIRSFLQMKNRGIEGLKATRQFIAKNKAQLPHNQPLLYSLIKRLIKIVHKATPAHAEFSAEASRFLGEIGSLQIADSFYYFETDTSFYADAATTLEPIEYFVRALYASLERFMLTFNAAIQRCLCEAAQLLVSSKKGKQLLVEYPYFNVFVKPSGGANCLDTCASIAPIDWLATLQSTKALVGYDAWIRGFVSQLFASFGWQAFADLAGLDAGFADAVLQPFVRLLMPQKEQQLDGLKAMLNYYFDDLVKTLKDEGSEKQAIFREKRVVQKFLDICECIRIHNNWQLPVNLLHVSKACNYCQANFMSIMYQELWALSQQTSVTVIDSKSQADIIADEQFQESALKAYKSIGCTDAITAFLNPLHSRVGFLSLDNNWADILVEAQANDDWSDQVYLSIMKRNGMFSLAGISQTNVKALSGKTNLDYEVCWRLCRWDTLVEGHTKVNTLNDLEYEFEKHHFNALKCLHHREEQNSLAAVANARHCVVSILKEISFECLQSVYKYLTWLQLLRQVEDFCQVQFGSATSLSEIFEKYQLETELQYGNFQCKELVLSHQIALFSTAGLRATRKINDFYNENPIESCLLKCIKECKAAGKLNLAKRNIAQLKLMDSNEHMKVSVLLEDAEVCFQTGKTHITKAILQHVLNNKAFAYCQQRVRAYRLHGEYLLESKEESFESVLRNYFNGSMNLVAQFERSKDELQQRYPKQFNAKSFADFEMKSRKSAYKVIAKYADREYTQLNTYTTSDEFEMKCRIIQENRQAAESVGKQNKNRELNIGAVFMKKFANLDEQEVQSIEQKRTDNLCIALENYMLYCRLDDAISSPAIYRIIALWFANKQNTRVQAEIEKHIDSIPSYKFICALNQITARLNSKNEVFLAVLKRILVRCAQEHPHQTLYQLYALVYAFNDSTAASSQAKTNNRVAIAKEIIAKAKNSGNANCIKQLEAMLPALIEFANFDVGANPNKSMAISISDKLKRLGNLNDIQCPTIELPVSRSGHYIVTGVIKWESEAQLVGGINAPKKIKCRCTDGRTRSQLLKGKDDLRQDAVMQQVFTMINDLLRGEPEAMERKLMVRTYRVVPLSMRSGILEWCDNTIPIGTYLVGDGKNGAHKKYHPDDITSNKCRQMSMQLLKADIEKRHQMYLQICNKLHPVFHYFLLEKFLVPGVWFERRLAYTNSVATTSIVGYILGLGDRHTQNILIDEQTAEMVHIDFGIAFEQGKIMPTPETVPFRLTRDMIAPMGICGTNGVFKRSCEATMRILRRHQSIITTILEVLLYDPLYLWKVVQTVDTSNEANAADEKNLTAQRALLCVQNKLEGKQAGILGTSSVDVQVQRLINDAISTRNLCQLYPGWDPYL